MTKRILLSIASLAALAVVYFVIQSAAELQKNSNASVSTVMNTNGVLHTVPLADILSGGPEKDEIPPINNPEFISINEANSIYADNDRGIVLNDESVSRFYPLRILAQHQIVNDSINSKNVLITYSPLTASAVVFNPIVQNQETTFGNTGLLWDSNLVLYDTKTESQWSQILGEAIVGTLSKTKLERLPCAILTFGAWKPTNNDGKVLAFPKETGFDYSRDPHDTYYASDTIYFPPLREDTRLSAKEVIVGVTIGTAAKAYTVNSLKEKKEITDSIGGTTYRMRYIPETETIQAFEEANGSEKRKLPTTTTYWFAWIGAYPDTSLYN